MSKEWVMRYLGIGLVIVGLLGTVPLIRALAVTPPTGVRASGPGISIEFWTQPRQLASSCLLAAVHAGVEPSIDLADRCVEASSAVFAATN